MIFKFLNKIICYFIIHNTKLQFLFLQDMYVYLSEDSNMDEVDDKDLIWKKTGLVYGDWASGPNNDGTYTVETSFTPSKVWILQHLSLILFGRIW